MRSVYAAFSVLPFISQIAQATDYDGYPAYGSSIPGGIETPPSYPTSAVVVTDEFPWSETPTGTPVVVPESTTEDPPVIHPSSAFDFEPSYGYPTGTAPASDIEPISTPQVPTVIPVSETVNVTNVPPVVTPSSSHDCQSHTTIRVTVPSLSTVYSTRNCTQQVANPSSYATGTGTGIAGATVTLPGVVVIYTGDAACNTTYHTPTLPPATENPITTAGVTGGTPTTNIQSSTTTPSDLFTGAAARDAWSGQWTWSWMGVVVAGVGAAW